MDKCFHFLKLSYIFRQLKKEITPYVVDQREYTFYVGYLGHEIFGPFFLLNK